MENKHKHFRPYDRVLVRDSENRWQIDFYSHWSKEHGRYITLAYGNEFLITDGDVLPFEGNEHLVGTSDEPEEEIRLEEGEWLMVSDFIEGIKCMYFTSSKFEKIDESLFRVKLRLGSMYYKYAIRASDYIPGDMEESKKKILCVKNGKIIRYKE